MSNYDIARGLVGLLARQTSVVGHDDWRSNDTRAFRYKDVPTMTPERRREYAANLLKDGLANERVDKNLPPVVTTLGELPADVVKASGLSGKPDEVSVVDIKAVEGIQLPVERLDSEGVQNNKLLTVIIDTAESKGVELAELLNDDAALEELGDKLHEIWMAHNSYMKTSQPELFVPYAELTREEQLKDIGRVKAAINNLVAGLTNLDALTRVKVGL